MDVSEVHKTKGKICTYTLKFAGDDTHDFYIAVGMSQDLEKRMLQHTGAAPGGSQWTALHPPTDILSIQIHETVEQAFACEAALWRARSTVAAGPYFITPKHIQRSAQRSSHS